MFLRGFAKMLAKWCEIVARAILITIYEDFADYCILHVFSEVFGAMQLFHGSCYFARVLSYSVATCSPPYRQSVGLLGGNPAFRSCFWAFSKVFDLVMNVEN